MGRMSGLYPSSDRARWAALEHEHPHAHDEHYQYVHAIDVPPGEPHIHCYRHERLKRRHAHYPDLHDRHDHAR